MKQLHGTVWLAGALVLSSACFADSSRSSEQSPSTDDETLQEVVITGSLIRGPQYSPSPLRTFTEIDIKESGYATIHGFLNAQPSFFRGTTSEANGGPANGLVQTGALTGSNTQATNLTFAQSVNLHGVGDGSTLVLFNGMRVAKTAGNFSTNLLALPASAVEQVDILNDGASALYGSDAVAGVINFHLRRDYSGQETHARYGFATEGGGAERQISQTLGRNWQGGSFLVSGEYFGRGDVDAGDRSFSNELPSPTRLLPDAKSYSALVTARQEISSGIELTGTGLYSKRRVHSLTSNDVGPPETPLLWVNDHHGDETQYSLMGGGSMHLGATWLGTLDVNVSHNESSRRQVQSRGPLGTETFNDAETSATKGAGVTFDGTVFEWRGAPVKAAVGGQYRQESFDPGRTDFSRHSKAAFGQLLVPYAFDPQRIDSARLELTAAGRCEDYSDFGSHCDPKVGLVFALPSLGMNFRSTWGKSFTAPEFLQLHTPDMGLFFPVPNATGGMTLAAFRAGGNPELQPQKAKTFTAGFDIRPSDFLRGFTLSATYFAINERDRIEPSTGLFDVFLNPQYFGRIDPTPDQAVLQHLSEQPDSFNPTGLPWSLAQVLVDDRYLNIASMRLNGIDLLVGYELPVRTSVFHFTLDTTYLLKKALQQSASAPRIEVLNQIDNPVDLRMRAGMAWRYGAWSVASFVNYTDDYKDSRVPPTAEVSSWTTVDLTLRYQLPFTNRSLRNMEVGLFGQNVFGAQPPYVRDFDVSRRGGVHIDGANASLNGPVAGAEFTLSW